MVNELIDQSSESSEIVDFSNLNHPLSSCITPFFTIRNVEWEGRIIKLTLVENIKHGNGISNAMHFLPCVEDSSYDYEVFFYFITKLNQPTQIPIRQTFLDGQGFIYWTLSDEVVEEIKAERNKWHALGYDYLTDYHQANKLLVEQGIANIQRNNIQRWLDKNYPKENRNEVEKILLNEPGLEGELDLEDFTYTYYFYGSNIGVKIHISSQVDETKLTFKNLLEKAEIILETKEAQRWLDFYYPQQGTCIRKESWENHKSFGKKRAEITKLDIGHQGLEGNLNLNNFPNLKELYFTNSKITSLNLNNCSQLEKINCSNNLLINITLPTSSTNLKELNLSNNNFPEQDLSFLVPYTNLESLYLGCGTSYYGKKKVKQGIYNSFAGSLDYLSEMKKLKILDISNTDINEVNIDKLPRSLEKIECSTEERPKNKVKEIKRGWFRLFSNYGKCSKCYQPNIGSNCCRFCNSNISQDVRDFIWDCHSKATNSKEEIKWIPYEQFKDVEYLAEGGFSKIYKAKLKWEEVVLKSLNSSRDIKKDFLQEIANYKKFSTSGNLDRVVDCCGISQDPQGNYVMVMEYVKDGNLRIFLKNNRLNFQEKLDQLWRIVTSLRDIHKKDLTHRDFHSGNILNRNDGAKRKWENDVKCFITDLGLCRPADEIDNSNVYGVLPYVATEVLSDKGYTKSSDIYSFGIVAYELFANAYPYDDLDFSDETSRVTSASEICGGKRPNIDKVPIPQLLKDLIKNCWDADPDKRPSAEDLKKTIDGWRKELPKDKEKDQKTTEFYQQYLTIKYECNAFSRNAPYQIHPTAVTTSKMIDTKLITQLLRNIERMRLEKELEETKEKLEEIRISLESETAELVNKFIEVKKESLKNEDKQLKKQARWLKKELAEAKGLAEEKIDEIIRHCEKLVELEQQSKTVMDIDESSVFEEGKNSTGSVKRKLTLSAEDKDKIKEIKSGEQTTMEIDKLQANIEIHINK